MCIDCVGCCFRVQHTISVVTPHTHTHTHKFTLVLCLVSSGDVSLFWVLGETDLSSDWSLAGLRSAASSVSYWLGLNVFPSAFDADSSLFFCTSRCVFVFQEFGTRACLSLDCGWDPGENQTTVTAVTIQFFSPESVWHSVSLYWGVPDVLHVLALISLSLGNKRRRELNVCSLCNLV